MAGKGFKGYLAEGALIVFSVLFALFINKVAENHATQNKKEIALASIEMELKQNLMIIQRWKAKHENIVKRIGPLYRGQNDSILHELQEYNYFNLGVLTNNESLFDTLTSNTAWETAKSTGIIAEFDFKITQKLTFVYELQQTITERTSAKLLDLLFDASSHRMDQVSITLTQFQLLMAELTGQERLLEQLYLDALENIGR